MNKIIIIFQNQSLIMQLIKYWNYALKKIKRIKIKKLFDFLKKMNNSKNPTSQPHKIELTNPHNTDEPLNAQETKEIPSPEKEARQTGSASKRDNSAL